MILEISFYFLCWTRFFIFNPLHYIMTPYLTHLIIVSMTKLHKCWKNEPCSLPKDPRIVFFVSFSFSTLRHVFLSVYQFLCQYSLKIVLTNSGITGYKYSQSYNTNQINYEHKIGNKYPRMVSHFAMCTCHVSKMETNNMTQRYWPCELLTF